MKRKHMTLGQQTRALKLMERLSKWFPEREHTAPPGSLASLVQQIRQLLREVAARGDGGSGE